MPPPLPALPLGPPLRAHSCIVGKYIEKEIVFFMRSQMSSSRYNHINASSMVKRTKDKRWGRKQYGLVIG